MQNQRCILTGTSTEEPIEKQEAIRPRENYIDVLKLDNWSKKPTFFFVLFWSPTKVFERDTHHNISM